MTNGHLDVLRGALELADSVVMAVGVHPRKIALFTPEARVEMLTEIVAGLGEDLASRALVIRYYGLMVDAARKSGATLLVRGIRDSSDLDAEFRMAAMNHDLAPELRTIFLPAAPAHRHISATLVRQIAEMKADASAFVPPAVARRLAELR